MNTGIKEAAKHQGLLHQPIRTDAAQRQDLASSPEQRHQDEKSTEYLGFCGK
jgi:hypothetical protein